jgi:RNA polymerase sigma-70 factor (ECF subfamily)
VEPLGYPIAGSRSSVEERALELRKRLSEAVHASCPTWLASQADDVIQAAYLKLAAILEKSEGSRDLSSSYLRKVASSAVIDEIRRRRRLREVPIVDENQRTIETPTDRPGPEQHVLARAIAGGLRECLDALVERADNLVYRGLEDLRQCLRAKGLEP